MKTTRTFKGSWYLISMVVSIAIGELLAAEMNSHFGLRASPVTVAFFCMGFVALIAMILYDDANLA